MRPAPGPIAVVLLSSACSWTFVQGPPANHAHLAEFDCTTSVAAPVLDLLLGGVTLAAAINVASADDRTWSGTEDRGSAVATALGWTAVSILSAGYGFTQASQCRAAKDEQYARLTGTDFQFDRVPPWPPGVSLEACAPLVPAVARAGTDVHAGPDPLTRISATIREETVLCAGNEIEGFGMRRVRMQDARTGFVAESSLSWPQR